jgi:RecQ family ATP-dependent DNA helicase
MPSSAPDKLISLLNTVFGFSAFRANQEPVCRAAIDGHDVLLVMPTGAGKSLCYQLPALALGGTALVVSPLIALMEDQVAKLASLGLRVARIHSGLDRAVSRQACVDYLAGNLDFLFIAPERLRVPGFPELLAKRKPALIAIDEAHCISQWGHDFRPDYRMLGQYVPALRPAPVLALTATATPAVQRDIIAQLGLAEPRLFIHGFRRDNLAIEVVELPTPDRARVIASLLAAPERRPAIVYAPSRKLAERLAEELSSSMRTAAYHAGLDTDTRDRVQTAFQSGALDAVVATIAFGMGIDKADIRTVIHAGLPGTLEGYYQEIGRAGRDSQPSRTFLLHSYADQRTQDFLLNRAYPPTSDLEQLYAKLTREPQHIDELRPLVKLDEEQFDRALEKLEIHGGAQVDFSGTVIAGTADWKKTYAVQAQHRAEQLNKVLEFTGSSSCRMAALVRHFGDDEDAVRPCGVCDVCDPHGAMLRQFRHATTEEARFADIILDELRPVDYKAAGTLQRTVDPMGRLARDDFDALIDAMTRAGWLSIENAEYEKDGQIRRYRKVALTQSGIRQRSVSFNDMLIDDGITVESAATTRKLASSKKKPRAAAEETPAAATPESEALFARLQAWRADEAKRLRVPAFVILHDRTLRDVARSRPRTPNQLLAINGMGPAKVDRFGEALLQLCSSN